MSTTSSQRSTLGDKNMNTGNQRRGGEEIDVDIGKSSTTTKPPIADRLEKEGQELLKNRENLTKDELEKQLKDAEERRQAILQDRVCVSKDLEGHGGLRSHEKHEKRA